MAKPQIRTMLTANPIATNIGRITVTTLNNDAEPAPPRFEMIWTMTRPAISSVTAAPLKTAPSLVFARPVAGRVVKVVPMLVEQRAAPAAKA